MRFCSHGGNDTLDGLPEPAHEIPMGRVIFGAEPDVPSSSVPTILASTANVSNICIASNVLIARSCDHT